jgi:hypothetical protein
MGLCTGLTRAEFALRARRRSTGRAPDSLYLFQSWFLSLHDWLMMQQSDD